MKAKSKTKIQLQLAFDEPAVPNPVGSVHAHQTLLGGLIRCGNCGKEVVACGEFHYGCASHQQQPSMCARIHVPRILLEQTLLHYLHRRVLAPARRQAFDEEMRRIVMSGELEQRFLTVASIVHMMSISDAAEQVLQGSLDDPHIRNVLKGLLVDAKVSATGADILLELHGMNLPLSTTANDNGNKKRRRTVFIGVMG